MTPSPDLPDTALSLTALAEWVRGLPVASLAPVGILFVAGLLLLCFGQRLLKPVLVLASIVIGVIVAARVGPSIATGVPPVAWSAIGAITGLVVAVLSYRLLLGLAMGVIGGVVFILLALTAVQLGWIDVTSKPPPVNAAAATVEEDDSEGLQRPVMAAFEAAVVERVPTVLAALTPSVAQDAPPAEHDAGSQQVARELDQVKPGLGGAFLAWLDRMNGMLGSTGTWLSERWSAMPRPMQTLLTASGAMGGFLGFATGLAAPTWAGAMLTSLFGSLLALLCGAPILSRVVSAESLPEVRPLGWLVLWLGIAVAGSIFQWLTRPAKPAGKREQADADAAA